MPRGSDLPADHVFGVPDPTAGAAHAHPGAISAWVGVFAPRGTPREVVARLNRDINQILARPEVRERLVGDGADPAPMSVEQFGDFVRSEIRRSTELLSEAFCSRLLFGGCAGFAFVE